MGRAVPTTDRTIAKTATGPAAVQPVTVSAGSPAVLGVLSAANDSRCVAGAHLTITLAGISVAATLPGSVPGLCAGGDMTVSPASTWANFLNRTAALSGPASSAAFHVTSKIQPPRCSAASLSTRLLSRLMRPQGTTLLLQLRNKGARACTFPGASLAVRANEPGARPVAKLLADRSAERAGDSLVVEYRYGGRVHLAAPVRPGARVVVPVLMMASSSSSRCSFASSVTVYPSAIALGAGSVVNLNQPVRTCGHPYVLPILGLGSSGSDMIIASSALVTAAGQTAPSPTGDSAGFQYGTDSNSPTATGSGPYYEPDTPPGDSAPYGTYIGERGAYDVWKGCTSGLNWNATNYDDAELNHTTYMRGSDPYGAGAAPYWMMGGPGRDPNYNDTTSEATAWGKAQAVRMASDAGQYRWDMGPYIFMDIEAAVAHGWNAAWSSTCGGTEIASSIPVAQDNATFNAFRNYMWNNTIYTAGVYCAGGGGSSSWSSIFGSTTNTTVPEWTYVNETTSLATFPNDWTISGGPSAVWFGGRTGDTGCALMWQWSGGNGDLNGHGDFDQLDEDHMYICHP